MRLFLSGDSWSNALGEFNSTGYSDLATNMFSSQPSIMSGWKFLITPTLLAPNAINRISDRELTAAVPVTAAYAINTPETITFSIPSSATTSERTYYAASSFVIQAASENIAVSGTRLDEEMLRSSDAVKKITFRLYLGQARFWNSGLLMPLYEGRTQFLQDIESTGEEPLGWNSMVKRYLRPEANVFLEPDAEDGLVDGQQMSLSLVLTHTLITTLRARTIRLAVSGPPLCALCVGRSSRTLSCGRRRAVRI